MKLNQSNIFLTNLETDSVENTSEKYFNNWIEDIPYLNSSNTNAKIEDYKGNSGLSQYFQAIINIINVYKAQNTELLYNENKELLYNRSNSEDKNSIVGQFINNLNSYLLQIILQYKKMNDSLPEIIGDENSTLIEELNDRTTYFKNVNEELNEYKADFLKKLNII